jgi:uncharacterized membrane protein
MRGRWFGAVVVGLMVVASALVFDRLPDRIPTHWNIDGEADGWMARWPGAFLSPMLGLGLWLLMPVLRGLDPRRKNYERFDATFWIVVNVVLLFVALVHGATLAAALGWPVDVARVILVALGLLAVALGNYLPRVRSNWWMGIRTPWTLEDEEVWRDTHRLAGRTFVMAGVVMLGAAFLPSRSAFFVSMGAFMAAALLPAAYSYVLWRRKPREA